jgi:hypothetical protein
LGFGALATGVATSGSLSAGTFSTKSLLGGKIFGDPRLTTDVIVLGR